MKKKFFFLVLACQTILSMEMTSALYNACEEVRHCREKILILEQQNMQDTPMYKSYCSKLEKLRKYVRNLISPGCAQDED